MIWLMNIVGVSNQLSWIAIGVASLRFRAGLKKQGLEHLLPFKSGTYPYGPMISVILNTVLLLAGGWSSFTPSFRAVDFVSYYIQLPIMLVMFVGWKIFKKTRVVRLEEMDLVTDRFDQELDSVAERDEALDTSRLSPWAKGRGWKERIKAVGYWLFF